MPSLKALTSIVIIAAILLACSSSESSDKNDVTEEILVREEVTDSIGFYVERAVDEFFSTTPQAVGVSVGVVLNEDIHSFHFGTVSLEGQESPTDGSVYGIASITKTFTGVLLAKATLDGKLGLFDDIRDYLSDEYPNLEQDGFPIEVAQLINHTSGLPNTMPDRPEMYPDYPAYEGDVSRWMHHISTVFDEYSTQNFLADLHNVELDTIPGTRFSYSNAGPKLAGYILEKVYERPYEVLVDSFISRPLKMGKTGITLDPDENEQIVKGYDETGSVMPPVLEAYGAAGALKSTIVDLASYVRWHLNEGDAVVALSHTPPGGQAQDPVEGYAQGLSWQMIRSNGIRRIWQDGNIPGYSSRVVLYPELGLGIAVMANQLDRSIPERIERIADAILESMNEKTFTSMEGL